MNLHEFKQLNQNEQTQLVLEHGAFVATRMTPKHQIHLCMVEDFYVEMILNPRDNHIEIVRSFRSTQRLQPYLNQIDISGIFQK